MFLTSVGPHSNQGFAQTAEREKHEVPTRLFQYTDGNGHRASWGIGGAHSCPHPRFCVKHLSIKNITCFIKHHLSYTVAIQSAVL